jgi:phage terminase large subunit
MIPPGFDFKNPNYSDVWDRRIRRLEWLRQHPDEFKVCKLYYRQFPADFIDDWGVTFDPRNADRKLPTIVPMLLFPKQREMIDYILRKWRARENGLIEKSRDAGASYVALELWCTMCIFTEHPLSIGFGSRKEEYVDKSGQPKSLFWKARLFLANLPKEFRAGHVPGRDSPHMRIHFPETGSVITGEAGDQIGRGDRTTAYMVDEAAHLERPELIDFSLQATTNCRIDISSVNGMNNPFAQKRHEGKIEPFIFDWREDPRKDDAWYAKMCAEHDPVVVAQEIDRDYSASVHGIVIPGPWVRACIDAREKLGLKPSGQFALALDVADEGLDKNAVVGGRGVEISVAEEWSGKGSDGFHTVTRAFEIAEEHSCFVLRYDADGMGALVRGDARVINDQRRVNRAPPIAVEPFRSSDAVYQPDALVDGTMGDGNKGRTNKDYFANRKAQGWWALRKRAQKTFRWVNDGIPCDPDDILSISSKMPLYQKLVTELSQPTYSQNGVGKMVINKKPDGMKSPNLADGAMMRFAPNDAPALNITSEILMQVRAAGGLRRRRAT